MGREAVEMTWTPVNVFEKSIGAAQDTYSPRFVAYLARFLVNYDRCGPKGAQCEHIQQCRLTLERMKRSKKM